MNNIKELQIEVDTALQELNLMGSPANLYDPISYIIAIGGKRIRPAMALAAFKIYKEQWTADCRLLANAIELFHNFTLVHDDLMDNSEMRRGNLSVHSKWDQPTAILSGDLMLIKVYELLASLGNPQITKKFNKMAVALCEGQMLDMDFEQLETVDNALYLEMIEKKTAVLLAFALESGAMLADASQEDQNKLYQLGIHLGLAFQLTDDYLDAFGQEAAVGKRIGGDILEQKKTYLWNEMISSFSDADKVNVQSARTSYAEERYIELVKNKMRETEADIKTMALAKHHHQEAIKCFESIQVRFDSTYLENIINLLEKRSF